MENTTKTRQFCGRQFSPEEMTLVCEVVSTCGGISRQELAYTVCELLDWKRANGKLKERECRDFLEHLEQLGLLKLPEKKPTGSCAPRKRMSKKGPAWPYSGLTGSVEHYTPLCVEPVSKPQQRQLFCDLVSRYHYLGYSMPFGARLQYLVYTHTPREVVGCVQFSSPAWRLKVRDQWIGWDDVTRGRHLQHVVNNSRFLVLARIKNLASSMLSAVVSRLRADWQARYSIDPWLVETMVDRKRYHGGCYRAANWIELGDTSGRGRMDRCQLRHGADVKTVLAYPLVKNAALRLASGR
ncbi:MAG: DUF4338 domain-containing protein [Desulfobacterales bacterium]|nr:DUF4338 domain-containing protein [Desulfobacterales bacterium]